MGIKTKLNDRLALWQKAALFEANISANKISLPQDQSYMYAVIHFMGRSLLTHPNGPKIGKQKFARKARCWFSLLD